MHRTVTVAVIGLPIVLAPAALAQTFEGRVGFRNDHSPRNTPTGNSFTISSTGTHEFEILFGQFNAQGFNNRGMFNFIGDVTLTDPAGNATMAPHDEGSRRSPYNGNGIAYGNGSPGNATTFDAFRGTDPNNPFAGDMYVVTPWLFGQPMPSAADTFYRGPYDRHDSGSGAGIDEYFPGYRFTVDVTDLTARTITVDLSGLTQAVSLFFPLNIVAPSETTAGSVTFLPAGFVTDTVDATLTINVTDGMMTLPSPGSAALLGLGFAVAHRRRRQA